MRICSKCKIEKDESNFYPKKHPSGNIGFRPYCKECNHKARLEYRASSPKDNERNKAYNRQNAARIRGNKLRKYWPGSSCEQATANWDDLYLKQNSCCAICKRPGKRLHVDHHHGKGHVRGLLCNACNRALGYFQDSDEILLNAAEYIKVNS